MFKITIFLIGMIEMDLILGHLDPMNYTMQWNFGNKLALEIEFILNLSE